MRRLLVLWGGFGALIGAALGGAFDGSALLVLAAIGAVIGAVGAVVVRIGAPKQPPPKNYLAIGGCLIGAVVGSPLGAVVGSPLGAITGLGQPMLALFNPDLPPRDFEAVFGAIGGVFVGAVAGALVGAALSRSLGRKAEASDAAASP